MLLAPCAVQQGSAAAPTADTCAAAAPRPRAPSASTLQRECGVWKPRSRPAQLCRLLASRTASAACCPWPLDEVLMKANVAATTAAASSAATRSAGAGLPPAAAARGEWAPIAGALLLVRCEPACKGGGAHAVAARRVIAAALALPRCVDCRLPGSASQLGAAPVGRLWRSRAGSAAPVSQPLCRRLCNGGPAVCLTVQRVGWPKAQPALPSAAAQQALRARRDGSTPRCCNYVLHLSCLRVQSLHRNCTVQAQGGPNSPGRPCCNCCGAAAVAALASAGLPSASSMNCACRQYRLAACMATALLLPFSMLLLLQSLCPTASGWWAAAAAGWDGASSGQGQAMTNSPFLGRHKQGNSVQPHLQGDCRRPH